jgi:branched-chain amino acid transport system ATP-binding protein
VAEHLLRVENLVRRFGGLVATDNLSMEVAPGELHAIIGPNGAGKTTLISQLTGQLMSNSGAIHFAGTDVTGLPSYKRSRLGLARSFQITSIFDSFTAEDNVALAVQATEPHSFRFWQPADRIARLREPARRLIDDVGLARLGHLVASRMSHGQHRQLELGMALATSPVMLLLDEPMAGLGIEESRAMSQLLASVKGQYTILLIEHDMDVVFSLADRISVLVGGRIIASGTADEIRNHPGVRVAYLGEEDDELVDDDLEDGRHADG